MADERILVTGGCGYLGSRVVRDLVDYCTGDKIYIRILDNMQSGQQRALMDLPQHGQYEVLEGDILDPSTLRTALRGVDAVVHLAAIVQTPLSFGDPNWVEQVNHWGTAHLVEACLEQDIDTFVYASSTAVYGPGGSFSEEDACQPVGAYAHSKHEAERCIVTAVSRGLAPTVLRLGGLYGIAPVTRFDAVANRFAYLAGIARTLTIYGEGKQKRPLIHVNDASKAICWALQHREATTGQVLNVHEQNASVLDIAEAVQKARSDVRKRFTEQDIRTHLSFEVDGSKIRNLGWQATVSLDEGMAELVDRFKGFVLPVARGTHAFPE